MCIVFNMKKIITQECFFCFNSILLERFFPFLRIKKKGEEQIQHKHRRRTRARMRNRRKTLSHQLKKSYSLVALDLETLS